MNSMLIVLAVLIGLWTFGIVLGYVAGIGKSFKNTTPEISAQADHIKTQQRNNNEAAHLKQKQLMDSMKQRIFDQTKKF